jgi:carboxyl-terminal processing protease
MALAHLCMELYKENLIFDYATKFKTEHENIPSVENFSITDSIYSDFKNFVIAKDFKYQNSSQDGLKKLVEIIKRENFYEESKELLDSLEAKLTHNIDEELDRYRKEVSQMLSSEIVKRYYFSRGEAQEVLKTDEELKLCIEILNDQKRYHDILQGK